MVAKQIKFHELAMRYKRGARSGLRARYEEDDREEPEDKDDYGQLTASTSPGQAPAVHAIPNLSDVQSVLLTSRFSQDLASSVVADKTARILQYRGFDVKANGKNLELGDTGREIQIYKRPNGEWAAKLR